MPPDQRAPSSRALSLLATGQVEIQGRMPWSSNGTFLVTVSDGEDDLSAIYKPGAAERPLWDFPGGLYRREVAAFELDRALGWSMVPETVDRHDGPLGAGSLQRFVNADFQQHYFTLLEDDRHHRALRTMAVFDVVTNNADRKGGHCLLDADGHLWGIDHGLCFHPEHKLRTVIWDFAGEAVDDDLLADLQGIADGGIPEAARSLLRSDECRALEDRVRALLDHPHLPVPRLDRPYPWPLV